MDIPHLVHPSQRSGRQTLRFSVFSLLEWPEHGSQSEVFENELEQLALAESQGYHCAWLAEHHGSHNETGPAIHLPVATLAARTRTIRIGSTVCLFPFTHPLRIAEEIAMLDIVSQGRIECAVRRAVPGRALSDSRPDVEPGRDPFYEQLEVIKRAWTEESFAHAGAFYNFDELRCVPSPVQNPGPTIHLAAPGPSALSWAAANGHPVLTDPLSPLEYLEQGRRVYLETAAAAGCDISGIEFPTLRHVYVGESVRKAREEAGPGLLRYYRSLAAARSAAEAPTDPTDEDRSFHPIFAENGTAPHIDPAGNPDDFLEFLFDECAIIGDESYCRDRIAALEETLDLSHLIAWQNLGDLTHEQTLASQERLIERVAPAFA